MILCRIDAIYRIVFFSQSIIRQFIRVFFSFSVTIVVGVKFRRTVKERGNYIYICMCTNDDDGVAASN